MSMANLSQCHTYNTHILSRVEDTGLGENKKPRRVQCVLSSFESRKNVFKPRCRAVRLAQAQPPVSTIKTRKKYENKARGRF